MYKVLTLTHINSYGLMDILWDHLGDIGCIGFYLACYSWVIITTRVKSYNKCLSYLVNF